ncbi:MAG: threonine synthase [Cyanobacteriota bacterium ELA615]|jgi:threonine synthase
MKPQIHDIASHLNTSRLELNIPSCTKGIIETYTSYLPVTEATPIVTLKEGSTPLIPLNYVSSLIGRGIQVLIKYDGLNPTGSFKDRGMTMAISKAKEDGAQAVICASTGNTSASAAAYATRAGLKAFVIIPQTKVAMGKLAQALLYGAEVIGIDGNFDQALSIVRNLGESHPVTIVNSVNPYRLQGQKSAAFEIVDVMGESPDYVFIPVGNGGNITAYWMGFSEYYNEGKCTKLPKMMGFQAAGSAPLVINRPVVNPETIATAIRIGQPANWHKATAAKDASGGEFNSVTDEEILNAYRILAGKEGIFCEPASAASVAGVIKHADKIVDNAVVVCVLTGNGLKDADCAITYSGNEFKKGIAPSLDAVAHVMGF